MRAGLIAAFFFIPSIASAMSAGVSHVQMAISRPDLYASIITSPSFWVIILLAVVLFRQQIWSCVLNMIELLFPVYSCRHYLLGLVNNSELSVIPEK